MATRRGLTGGTGDVNPQFLSFRAAMDTISVTKTVAVPIPIQRMTQGAGRAQVLEVLAVKYDASTQGGSNGTEDRHT